MSTPALEILGSDAERARLEADRLVAELEQRVVAEHATGATVSSIARDARLTRNRVYAILRRHDVEIDSERGRRLVSARHDRHRPVLAHEAPVAFWEQENQRIDGTALIPEALEILASEPEPAPEMDFLGFIEKMRREAAAAGYND